MQEHSREGQACLTLFVTGDAPRSQRARANLANAMEALDIETTHMCEVDLLAAPERTFEQGILATPALRCEVAHGSPQILYGDLSERDRLEEFLQRNLSAR